MSGLGDPSTSTPFQLLCNSKGPVLPGDFRDQTLITFYYNKLRRKIMGVSHKSRIDLPGLGYVPLEY